MGNLKTLRGLLACIAFLESASTNSVNAQCQDRHGCAHYRFPSACEGKHKEWYLKNCPKSCKACPADQLSNMYVEKSTIILISSKSTIPEDRNVTDVNKVPVQPERTTVTTRILLSTGGAATCLDKAECSKYRLPLDCTLYPWHRENCQASCNACPGGTSKTTRTSTWKVSSQIRRTTPSKRVASVTAVSGQCKDGKECTRYNDLHLRCSGTDGWYREHCRLSCNMCITDHVSVTRYISHTSTTSPVRSRNVSVQVHDDVTLAISPVRSTNVSVQVYDDVTLAPSHPQRTVVTTWIPSPAGDGQNMEWVMNNIAVTVLTPILVILVIVIIVITKIKVSGRKVVLTPPREQSKVVVTYSGLTPQPEKQAYTAIDLEAHTYSSVDDIRHETEDYQNINDRGSQHIGMNQDQCTSDSRTLDCTLYEN